jgi:hypothetical protein
VPIAEITFNEDAVTWLGGPPLAAIAVVAAGLLVRNRSRGTAFVLLVIGGAGLVLAVAWIAFAFYVDALLGDT